MYSLLKQMGLWFKWVSNGLDFWAVPQLFGLLILGCLFIYLYIRFGLYEHDLLFW